MRRSLSPEVLEVLVRAEEATGLTLVVDQRRAIPPDAAHYEEFVETLIDLLEERGVLTAPKE
jgi:hypothetical protein